MTNSFIDTLSVNKTAPADIREKAVSYFQVAQALLQMAPDRVKAENRDAIVEYKEKDPDGIIAQYPQSVQDDIRQVLTATGESSAIFGTTEDFTQYKPRGHYTKNGILKSYFRAEMWFGRIHFLIAKTAKMDDTLSMEPVALFIVDTVKDNPQLYDSWARLFDPITDLIGLSDDLSFREILPLWKDQNVTDFSAWASDKKNLISFMELCHEKLRPPAISGNALSKGGAYEISGAEVKPPMGWRFMGQRFTYDSYIHEKVSAPRLMSRDIVRGLDIMKVFGSRSADVLLEQSDYESMHGLKDRLDSLQQEFAGYGSDFWNETYYNQVLYQIKTLATFEQGAGFYFTQSPAWNIKAELSAHGTWAELRHDTILYVKQVYAERSGDGDFDATFRTEPLPSPTHYIEPNVPFWKGSLASVEGLLSIYSKFDLLDKETETVLSDLHTLYKKALSIAEAETADKPISSADNYWIPTIPAKLGALILIHASGSEFIEDYDQFKMACIADVFTNGELGVVLETGIGIPYRIYVPLNDGQGGKRIAVGYGFSYYEFEHSQSDRMTDEQWKAIVYKNGPMDDYLPFWEKSCTLPADSTFSY